MAFSQASGRPRASFPLPSKAGLAASASRGPLTEDGGHGSKSTKDVVSLEAEHVRAAEECGGLDLDFDFRCYFLSAPRADLYHRIDRRCEEMVEGNPRWNAKRWLWQKDVDARCCCLGLHGKLRLARCMLKSLAQLLTGGMLQEADWMLREGVEPGSNPASRAIGYRQVRGSNSDVSERLRTLVVVETRWRCSTTITHCSSHAHMMMI